MRRQTVAWGGVAVMVAMVVVLFGGFLLLIGDDSSPDTVPSAPPPAPADVDPYDTYLKIAPADAPRISREDAQTRAVLGCGKQWAPGTVDAALATAYEHLCAQWASGAPRG